MKIKYELGGNLSGFTHCMTKCPNSDFVIMVGSAGCQLCKHFVSDDEVEREVECSYIEK